MAKYNIILTRSRLVMATNNTAALRADEKEVDIGPYPQADGVRLMTKGVAVFWLHPLHYVNGYTIAVDGGWLAR